MFKNYFKGIKAYGNAFSLMSTLGLWKYFLVPILISIVIALVVGFAAWGLSDNIGSLIAKLWVWEWGAQTFRSISNFMGGITVIALGLVLYKHLVMALSAPFMGPVSEKIEAHLTGKEITNTSSQFLPLLWRGIRVNMRNLLMELFLTLPILVLSLIPIVGIIATPLLFLVQAYYAGFGNMDYTLERHFDYKKSTVFVRSHSGLAMGNGTLFMLLLFIPVLGIILVFPLSVTAASIATLRILYPSEKTNTP
ncbi:MAG: coproporphyrinogen III oxidase [Alteromonas sp.]|nr:coproporphyrinogen III oxidase [Alteromonas sp.]MAY23888.1 coproporphyrinogen III oxidase [Flavobacteriaceae bacterium]|tara:strand:+ start:29809 stop:30561 length:753 start_codon:yes stop_codon:yes gene_type:complete